MPLLLSVAGCRWEQEDPAHELLRACYKHISDLSLLNEELGLKAGYEKGDEGAALEVCRPQLWPWLSAAVTL